MAEQGSARCLQIRPSSSYKANISKGKYTESNNPQNEDYNNEIITRKKSAKLSQHISDLKPCLP